MSETPVPEFLRQTMVERVADAILPGLRHYENCIGDPAAMRRADAIKYARIAIAAMREPNLDMRKVCSFEAAEVTWPAMIDAALSSPASTEED